MTNMCTAIKDDNPANRLDAARALVRLSENLNNADTISRLQGVQKLVALLQRTPPKSEVR